MLNILPINLTFYVLFVSIVTKYTGFFNMLLVFILGVISACIIIYTCFKSYWSPFGLRLLSQYIELFSGIGSIMLLVDIMERVQTDST